MALATENMRLNFGDSAAHSEVAADAVEYLKDIGDRYDLIILDSFKPDTDDMRDAPALDIIPALTANGAKLKIYDPKGMNEAAKLLKDVTWCNNSAEAMTNADALVILTEWNEFSSLKPETFKDIMKGRIIVDLRNVFDPVRAKEAGFDYSCIGR